MVSNGFRQSKADSAIIMHHSIGGGLILTIYMMMYFLQEMTLMALLKQNCICTLNLRSKILENQSNSWELKLLTKKNISLSQQKYALDLLNETEMIDYKSIYTPLILNHKYNAAIESWLCGSYKLQTSSWEIKISYSYMTNYISCCGYY